MCVCGVVCGGGGGGEIQVYVCVTSAHMLGGAVKGEYEDSDGMATLLHGKAATGQSGEIKEGQILEVRSGREEQVWQGDKWEQGKIRV